MLTEELRELVAEKLAGIRQAHDASLAKVKTTFRNWGVGRELLDQDEVNRLGEVYEQDFDALLKDVLRALKDAGDWDHVPKYTSGGTIALAERG